MGVGFLGLLTLLFIGLKLAGAITWPWLYVLAPVVIMAVVYVIILIVGGIVIMVSR